MSVERGDPPLPASVCRELAAFVGRLLVREVEAADLDRMRAPELAGLLRDLGLALPAAGGEALWLESRAAEYHDLFLRPETGPLVQSLWTQGRYEGDAAGAVRRLAAAAGVEFQRAAARGAAVDHLGSLLLLWAETVDRAPAVARRLAEEHLAWALGPLRGIEEQGGFYGALARLAGALLEGIRSLAPPRA